MRIETKDRNGPFIVVDDGIILHSIPDFSVAVGFVLDTLKRGMRKTDSLEVSCRYSPGMKAIGFHAEGNDGHGYHVTDSGHKESGRPTSCDDLNEVWKHCYDAAARSPFKISFVFWE